MSEEPARGFWTRSFTSNQFLTPYGQAHGGLIGLFCQLLIIAGLSLGVSIVVRLSLLFEPKTTVTGVMAVIVVVYITAVLQTMYDYVRGIIFWLTLFLLVALVVTDAAGVI